MRNPTRLALVGILTVALAALPLAGAASGSCSIGATPSATLLIPYFEVDFASAAGQTTLFSVTNASDEATLAHVVVWTDWGVPTLNFDLFLAPDDVQTVNLRDLFAGVFPQTGGGSFAGCTNPLTLPVLDSGAVTRLRLKHTGQADEMGHCAGSGRAGADVATGFVTIDVAQACSDEITYPGHSGYFAAGGTGIAANANRLVGDFFLVDTAENFAQGNEAVHIIADEARFGGSPSTFYGPWVAQSGTDARVPLGTRYRSRYLNGGAFSGGTDLIVWAAPTIPTPQAVLCGERPSFVDPCHYIQTTAFDEAAVGEPPFLNYFVTEITMRLTVGSVEVPAMGAFGFVDVENRVQVGCETEPTSNYPLQSWVMPLSSASGRFSVGFNAFRTGDDICQAAVPAAGEVH